jgi:hyperosmotically inducible periplasmic protein
MRTQHVSAVVATVSCLLAAGGAFAASGSGSQRDDASITSDVQQQLSKDPNTSGRQITVNTSDGVVDLSGMVSSATEKAKASQDAHQVKGVVEVKNHLRIVQ